MAIALFVYVAINVHFYRFKSNLISTRAVNESKKYKNARRHERISDEFASVLIVKS